VLFMLRAPRTEPLLLAGPVRARLAGADPGMWAATLCVEHADGFLQNVCEGVRRGAGEVTIELGDACIEVAAGQSIVLLVAGSSYPRWPRPAAEGVQRLGTGSTLELTVLPAA
jgi:hypothetical protein